MTWLALPWFVLTTTGSPARMTLVILAELLGLAVAGLPAGSFVQRFGARRSMLIADAGTGAADAAGAGPPLDRATSRWGRSSSSPRCSESLPLPYFTAQKVIVPELLGEDERDDQPGERALPGRDPGDDAARAADRRRPDRPDRRGERARRRRATYLVSFALVALFVPAEPAPCAEAEESRGILAGLRFLVHDPLLRVWIPFFVAGDAAWQAFFAAVPVLAVERFDADAKIAGALFAAFGAGALLGNFLSFRFLTQRVDGLRLIALSVPFQAAPLWLLTLDVGAPVCSPPSSSAASGTASATRRSTRSYAPHAGRDPRESDGRRRDALGHRHAARAALRRPGPRQSSAPDPVLVGFALSDGLHARRRRRPRSGRRRTMPASSPVPARSPSP